MALPATTLQNLAIICNGKGSMLTVRNASSMPAITLQNLAITLKDKLTVVD